MEVRGRALFEAFRDRWQARLGIHLHLDWECLTAKVQYAWMARAAERAKWPTT